jgi:hypothetical protein
MYDVNFSRRSILILIPIFLSIMSAQQKSHSHYYVHVHVIMRHSEAPVRFRFLSSVIKC